MLTLIRGGAMLLSLAQAGAAQFAGTWTATLGGQTYVRLELRESNGALTGRVSLGAMHFDANGVVENVNEPATNFTPIFDVSIRDGIVAFARKDGDDTDRFELRPAGAGLELAFVLSAEDRAALAREGVPLLKPVRLVKARP